MSSDPGPLSTRSAKLDIIPKGQKSLSKDPDQRAAVCIQRQLLRFGASSAVFGGSASRSRSGGASSSGPPPPGMHMDPWTSGKFAWLVILSKPPS